LNHRVLINQLKTKIDDQAFIDLIYKYFKVGYGECIDKIVPIHIRAIQEKILFPLLINIYMTFFDKWVENYLIPKYTKGKKKEINSVYKKRVYSEKVTDYCSILNLYSHDQNFIKLHYVRYADNFIMGLSGPKIYCEEIVNECRIFLHEQLKFTLNVEKTKITHSQLDSTLFLGYRVYKTKFATRKISYISNIKGCFNHRSTNIILDGPINCIVTKLIDLGYAKKDGSPTRNGKFINNKLVDIVEHYKIVERDILQYYKLANNYNRVAIRVHYILKYSCALTIASKMKLTTLRRVFNKYGKNLNIKDTSGKIITNYPMINYHQPKK